MSAGKQKYSLPLCHFWNSLNSFTLQHTWKQNQQSLTLKILSLTSISHKALLLVAEVADCRPVVRRKTYCFFLWSSHVRNFSCSAWNNRTTSPCRGGKHLSWREMSTLIFKANWLCLKRMKSKCGSIKRLKTHSGELACDQDKTERFHKIPIF